VSGGAALDKRPGLQQAIDALAPGRVLLAVKCHRLAHDAMQVAMIERVAERVGGTVMSCDAAGEETAPEAKLHVGALSERRTACAGARVLGSAHGVGSKGRL
jgi:DNA invertase Pin-like site-specific DNA recombinase